MSLETTIVEKTDVYSLHLTPIKNMKGAWNSMLVEIYNSQTNQKLGEYKRNYPGMAADTWFPFEQDGKEYALYSKDYTSTRVMTLPDCKDLCGEERSGGGFCPTEYWVPSHEDNSEIKSQFGFLSGCVWGDDNSWKVRYIDLSKISEGILNIDDRFGYIELLSTHSLKDAINVECWEGPDPEDPEDDEGYPTIEIACIQRFNTNEKEA